MRGCELRAAARPSPAACRAGGTSPRSRWWRCLRSRWADSWSAPSPCSNLPVLPSSWALPPCSAGRSAASFAAIGRWPIRSRAFRTGCYHDIAQRFVTSRLIRDEAMWNCDSPDASEAVDRSGRIPTGVEIGEINATHQINTPLNPADLLFVFGTRLDEVL